MVNATIKWSINHMNYKKTFYITFIELNIYRGFRGSSLVLYDLEYMIL